MSTVSRLAIQDRMALSGSCVDRVTDEQEANHQSLDSEPQNTASVTVVQERKIEPLHPGDPDRLACLALSLSHISKYSSLLRDHEAGTLPESGETQSNGRALDPSSPHFDMYKWARTMIEIGQKKGVKQRKMGVVFKNLNVYGPDQTSNYHKTISSLMWAPSSAWHWIVGPHLKTSILRQFYGVLWSGEMLLVLGRPGSGCSTLLKTIAGNDHGLELDQNSVLEYNGIPRQRMVKDFKGEVVYNHEVDRHFPYLTVGQTLEFASYVRTSRLRIRDISRRENAKYLTQVVMAIFGLAQTYDTKVGDDFVRGVSGGERKRVSIAEMTLAGSPMACWDNSTRGLDASTALEFIKALRMSADLLGPSHLVAIYQASQAIYDLFDKVIVLYEGREIYYGPARSAKAYFEEMGWYCSPQQTTAEFLTAVTNPLVRVGRPGFEHRAPQTADDFKFYWQSSQEYADLEREINRYQATYPIGGPSVTEFERLRRTMQSRYMIRGSPYTISVPMQVRACTRRAYQRLWNDRTATITTIISKIVVALVFGSVYYDTPDTTNSFFARGSVLFFSILFNALNAIVEINTLYHQRPIVEKHASYAFYHPFVEAFATLASDLPIKITSITLFSVTIYFLANLRRSASQFLIFWVFNILSAVTMSCIARTIGAASKTISKALAIAGIMVLGVVIYTGFAIPRPYMRPWFEWISWINPVAYAFEALLVNELHAKQFPCPTSSLIPSYPDLNGNTFICPVRGAVAGERAVSGDSYFEQSYGYNHSNLWRNFGILWAFWGVFLVAYLVFTELNSFSSSTAEVPVFLHGSVPDQDSLQKNPTVLHDIESTAAEPLKVSGTTRAQIVGTSPISWQSENFTWRGVTYDITTKDGPRRLLDNVSGYVESGTLTALMGVSGAGKTTLLDVLAQRIWKGSITGDMRANGRRLDCTFQRKTGYVQQQDLHLETSTVRESLQFSAMLRQSKDVSKKEKFRQVEHIIQMLGMEGYAEAIVGVPGEGLNVEQRKVLSIGVELAANPTSLLFLDEPTSGLDSQSSLAIVALLRKLAKNGYAILATIHQPSSMLFGQFDRLVLLAKGGRPVYSGDIGANANRLKAYFESKGARKCGIHENPAEYVLALVDTGTGCQNQIDWPSLWRNSETESELERQMDNFHQEGLLRPAARKDVATNTSEFAMPFTYQLLYVAIRLFKQYWRTPTYVYGKFFLGVVSGLFIGFSFFKVDNSLQGLQNGIFSSFLVLSIFSALVQQTLPRFVTQRSLYEGRERPSNIYHWSAFLLANILAELPLQLLLGIMVFASYNYPVFGIESSERQVLVLLFLIEFFLFASSFAYMLMAALPNAETAGQLTTVLFSLSLVFSGVLQPPHSLPKFWTFMWRVSPFTYFVQGIIGTALSGRPVNCSADELSIFDPPSGQTCGTYLAPFLQEAPGSLQNPYSITNCSYCPLRYADQALAVSGIFFSARWRNFGILWAYITFNFAATVILYYFFRVKKWSITSSIYVPVWLKGLFRCLATLLHSFTSAETKMNWKSKGRKPSTTRLF